ncbi:short-chain dehydrogenase [Cylindrobasidium torrendii FP15055 ss-10]|uniref:Short-chain dehydrogenase n=1 Tax=Cylindrobasidium torrendii FP15055 ss-10 TaxID=1314674 RepID=A0A0D7BM23_9AGAR|nr:short-chain dehydrogenase [Cylindrobasidium torrendii FP15055 ss-10]
MKWTAPMFLNEQLFVKRPAVEHTDLAGKIVAVVGANTGLGFQAAIHFASMNPDKLIMACRSKERGEAALNRLVEETGYKSAVLSLVDLADFASVTAFADRFEEENSRLDIVVYNAGMMQPSYSSTADGWETCLQVNNLGSPLLTLRLVPLMLRTAKTHHVTPRIVTVASDTHYWANVEALEELLEEPEFLKKMSDKEYCTPARVGGERYWICKLLNVLFTRALAEHLPTTITPVAVNPGLCSSELTRDLTKGSRIVAFILGMMHKLLAFTAEEGSRQLVYGAIGQTDDEKGLRGQFVQRSKVFEPSDFVLSPNGKRLESKYWEELIEVLSKIDSKIPSSLHEIGVL